MVWPFDDGGRRRGIGFLFAGLIVLSAAGCAGSGGAAEEPQVSQNDPAEGVNRKIFDANLAVDKAVLKPIAEAYQKHVPEGVRRGIHNVAGNLHEPAITANDLLQGNLKRAWVSARRFAINTTAGGAGVVDKAAEMNLPPHSADFGETMAVWGVGEGPFVELPALGPSNLRDAVGTVVGMVFDPLTAAGVPALTYMGYARGSADLVDTRAAHLQDLDDLEHSSIDFYATLRSVSRQQREAEIEKAKHPDGPVGRVDVYIANDAADPKKPNPQGSPNP